MDSRAIAAQAARIDWGTVPDWIAAIGTVAAFLVAAVAYAGSVWLSREAQARQVSMSQIHVSVIEAGTPLGKQEMAVLGVPVTIAQYQSTGLIPQIRVAKIELTVVNNSDEVMGPISIEFAETGSRSFLKNAEGEIDRIQPHQESPVTVVIPDSWHPMYPPLHVRMVFRDSAGRWWQRFENERVRRAPKAIRPPEYARRQASVLFSSTSIDWPPPPKAGSGWKLVGNASDGIRVATADD